MLGSALETAALKVEEIVSFLMCISFDLFYSCYSMLMMVVVRIILIQQLCIKLQM